MGASERLDDPKSASLATIFVPSRARSTLPPWTSPCPILVLCDGQTMIENTDASGGWRRARKFECARALHHPGHFALVEVVEALDGLTEQNKRLIPNANRGVNRGCEQRDVNRRCEQSCEQS